jgi:hypothetical protein
MLTGIDRWGDLSFYLVRARLVIGGLGSPVWGRCDKTKEIPMSVAHLTQGLLLLLLIANLQNSMVSCCFLVHSPRVLLASCFIFLDRVFRLWVTPIIWLVAFSPRSLKVGFASQQLLDRWWTPSIVVAMAIGVTVLSIFCHRKSKGWWHKKKKDRGGERISCNSNKKVLEVRRVIQQG